MYGENNLVPTNRKLREPAIRHGACLFLDVMKAQKTAILSVLLAPASAGPDPVGDLHLQCCFMFWGASRGKHYAYLWSVVRCSGSKPALPAARSLLDFLLVDQLCAAASRERASPRKFVSAAVHVHGQEGRGGYAAASVGPPSGAPQTGAFCSCCLPPALVPFLGLQFMHASSRCCAYAVAWSVI